MSLNAVASDCSERKSGYDVVAEGTAAEIARVDGDERPGSRTPGAGRKSSALTKLKTVTFAPVPTASVTRAIA